MAFKTTNKDEIATRRYQIIDNKTGAVINPDVALKRIDTPTQKGDKFMAVDVNAIGERLNGLEDGTEVVKDAENAKNAPSGLNVGSPENPEKVVQWWLGVDRKISMYGKENGFIIQLKKANGELIHTLLSADINGISTIDNSLRLGNQLPAYYAKASQFVNITKIREYHITTNPAGKNYFDIARASNEFIVPLSLTGASNVIEKIQYSGVSVRIILDGNISGNLLFYYMIVYV